jgi:hypothetical protein
MYPLRPQITAPTAKGLQSLSRRTRAVPTSARIPLVKLHQGGDEGVVCANCGLLGHSEERCAETGSRVSALWGDEPSESLRDSKVGSRILCRLFRSQWKLS